MGAPDLLILHELDNVGTALRELERGTAAKMSGSNGELGTVMLVSAIGLGHKAALGSIAKGSMIIKHGHPIGRATTDIRAGEHAHVHNVVSLSVEDDMAVDPVEQGAQT